MMFMAYLSGVCILAAVCHLFSGCLGGMRKRQPETDGGKAKTRARSVGSLKGLFASLTAC
nr:hypothetical protein [uncultured Kingella sp.]